MKRGVSRIVEGRMDGTLAEDDGDVEEDSEDEPVRETGTIDSVDGRPALTIFCCSACGFLCNPLFHSPLRLGFWLWRPISSPRFRHEAACGILAFGIGIFWEYIF